MVEEIEMKVRHEDLQVLVLLVLGDVGESLAAIETSLEILHDLASVKVYVPGNHDLYDTERLRSSLRRYQDLLPALAERNGYVWGVRERPLIVDDVAIATTSAWPLPETRIGEVDLDMREVREAKCDLPDARWITSDLRDDAISDEQLVIFKRSLAAIPNNARKIIVATHYPIMIEQLRREVTAYTPWFISPRFGNALHRWRESRSGTTVVEVISGHLHEHADVVIDGTRARVIDSGYRRPGHVVVEIA